MPNFLATLNNPTTGSADVTLDTNCSIVTVVDHSDYAASTEAGHLLADFTVFRQMKFTFPDGGHVIFDAQALPATWDAPSPSGTPSIALTLPAEAQDGVYTVELSVVPTHTSAVQYSYTVSNPSMVWSPTEGKLYKAIQVVPALVPITDTSYWEEITIEDLSAKYQVSQNFSLVCRKLYQCYEKLVHEANCLVVDDECDDNLLCSNGTFLDAVKLRMLIDGIGYASAQAEWDKATVLTNSAKSICNC
jgi:hypothetical protein